MIRLTSLATGPTTVKSNCLAESILPSAPISLMSKRMPSRNQQCFCGSGKRYKHCHGALSLDSPSDPIINWHEVHEAVRDAFNKQHIARQKHVELVGLHPPVRAAGVLGDRFVLRGGELLHWRGSGSFLNFLEQDLLMRLGVSASSLDEHPLNIWRRSFRRQLEMRRQQGRAGTLFSTASVLNFFTVAYDLFVLSDNTILRERLLKSLRVPDQFHGARYELMIAACLIRAGYKLEFSDETDNSTKHFDLTALHPRSGGKYLVEMKAKARSGVLGKPGNVLSSDRIRGNVSRLLRDALTKPAVGRRLVFIDMNLPRTQEVSQLDTLSWQRNAVDSVRAVERQPGKLPEGTSGFVIFTNSPSYHSQPDEIYEGLEVAFTGFNMPNFADGLAMLHESYPDIADIFRAFDQHSYVPDSFPD